MVKKSTDNDVKIRVTKLGGGKISIGVHIAASGDVMAQTATCSPCRRWRTNWKRGGWTRCNDQPPCPATCGTWRHP